MRIAFVVNNYPPRVGGVETHVHSLARHLHAAGHEIHIFTLYGDTGMRDEDGITVVRMPEYFRVGDILGFPSPGAKRRIARYLRDRDIEIVSVHTRFFPMSWVGLRAARRAGAAVIHTEHGSGHVVSASPVISLASRAVDLTVGRAVLRSADEVVGVSEQVVDFVRRLSGRQARVFYNAIEAPSRTAPITACPYRLVFVGRLVPGKGGDVFVDAVAQLRAQGHDVTGEMLGDGEERATLEARVRTLGLSEHIVLRGRVTPDEVRTAVAGATLLNPTTLAEGFQTTLLEALAEQARVVTFDVPGATLLAGEGHPVAVTAERTTEALVAATAAQLDGPEATTAAPSLECWYWSRRAQEYVQLCEHTVRARSTGSHSDDR